MIKKDATMLAPDFGSVRFYNDNCTLEFTIMDGKPLTGGTLTHNSSLVAPKGTVGWDDKGVAVNLNFGVSAASFENWNEIKRVTDEMNAFYEEFMAEYGEGYLRGENA